MQIGPYHCISKSYRFWQFITSNYIKFYQLRKLQCIFLYLDYMSNILTYALSFHVYELDNWMVENITK